LKEKAPINLWLLYGFATFEGMALGLILESYVLSGLGGAVMNATITTGAVTLAAGAYGAQTKRDLSGMGSILFIGLIAVLIAAPYASRGRASPSEDASCRIAPASTGDPLRRRAPDPVGEPAACGAAAARQPFG